MSSKVSQQLQAASTLDLLVYAMKVNPQMFALPDVAIASRACAALLEVSLEISGDLLSIWPRGVLPFGLVTTPAGEGEMSAFESIADAKAAVRASKVLRGLVVEAPPPRGGASGDLTPKDIRLRSLLKTFGATVVEPSLIQDCKMTRDGSKIDDPARPCPDMRVVTTAHIRDGTNAMPDVEPMVPVCSEAALETFVFSPWVTSCHEYNRDDHCTDTSGNGECWVDAQGLKPSEEELHRILLSRKGMQNALHTLLIPKKGMQNGPLYLGQHCNVRSGDTVYECHTTCRDRDYGAYFFCENGAPIASISKFAISIDGNVNLLSRDNNNIKTKMNPHLISDGTFISDSTCVKDALFELFDAWEIHILDPPLPLPLPSLPKLRHSAWPQNWTPQNDSKSKCSLDRWRLRLQEIKDRGTQTTAKNPYVDEDFFLWKSVYGGHSEIQPNMPGEALLRWMDRRSYKVDLSQSDRYQDWFHSLSSLSE